MFKKSTKWFVSILLLLFSFTSVHAWEYAINPVIVGTAGIYTDSRAYATLALAIADIAGLERDLYIARVETVGTLTIPANVRLHFMNVGAISVTTQLTMNTTQIFAKDVAIFAGVGDIDFIAGSVVRSSWFADFDEALDVTNDDTLTMVISEALTMDDDGEVGDDVTLRWESPLIINTDDHDLTNIGSIEAGSYQIFAVGTNTPDFLAGSVVKSSWFTSLQVAVESTGDENVDLTILIDQNETVEADTTTDLYQALKMKDKGCVISVTVGDTLTIGGQFIAGIQETFTGAGTVTFAADAFATEELISEWWGENTIPGTTDLTDELQDWLDASYTSKIPCFLSGGRHLVGKLYYSGQSIRGIPGSGAYEATVYSSEMSSLIGKDSTDILYYSVDSPYGADIFLRGTILKDLLIIVDDTTDAAASYANRGGAGNAGIVLEHLDGDVNTEHSVDNFTFVRARIQNVAIISKSMDANGKNNSMAIYQQGLIYDVVFDQLYLARLEYGFWGDYPSVNETDIEYAPDSLKFLNALIECMNPFRIYNSFGSTIDNMQVYGSATDDKGIIFEKVTSSTRDNTYFWKVDNLYQEIGNAAGAGEIGNIEGKGHIFTGGVLINAETPQYYTWAARYCIVNGMRINNKTGDYSLSVTGNSNRFSNIVTAFNARDWFVDTGDGNRIDIFDSAASTDKSSTRPITQNVSRNSYPALALTSHFAHNLPSTPYFGNEDLFFWPTDINWTLPATQPTITKDSTVGGSGEYATMIAPGGDYYFTRIGMASLLAGYQVPLGKVRIYAMVKTADSDTVQEWAIDVNGAGTEIDDKECLVTTAWSVINFDADLTGLTKGHDVFIRAGAPTANQAWDLAWVAIVPYVEHNLGAHIGSDWGVYDFDVNGGAVADHVIGTLFDNATITRAYYQIITPFTSGGAATVAIDIATNDVNGIVTATAYNNAVFNAGYHEAIQTGTVATFSTQTTNVRHIELAVAGAVLTAGKIKVFWEYVVGE